MLEFIAGGAVGMLLGGGGSRHTTTTVNHGPTHVHEHRAPTDESVKLLREMEDAVKKRIMCAYVSRSNDLHGAVVQVKHDHIGMGSSLWITFQLNGRDYQFTVDGPDERAAEAGLLQADEAGVAIAREIANVITGKLLVNIKR